MTGQLGIIEARALGTGLRLVVTSAARLDAARDAVDGIIREIDLACSRFRDDSELTRLNAASGQETVVSPLLMTALHTALRAARLSEGTVDPTVGAALKRVGYDIDYVSVARDGGAIPLTVRAVPGWELIRLNTVSHTVHVPAGVDIDLGSTAKALAADMAAVAAHAAVGHVGGVLVSLGGDIAAAGDPPPGGWRIQVAESSDDPITDSAETITIASGGVATSSTTVRHWIRGGVELHHIINPATGLPADGPWRTATVVAKTCVDANIAATAAIVFGANAVEWLGGMGLPARLVDGSGHVTLTSGWPRPGAAPPSRKIPSRL